MSDNAASASSSSPLLKTLTFVNTKDNNQKRHNQRRSLLAGLPCDILDLLGSFATGYEELGIIRIQLPSLVHESVSNAIEDLLCQSMVMKTSSNLLYSKSEHNLYQAHLCFAATTDVGRMLFDTRHILSPQVLKSFAAFHASKSPPAALFKRLKSLFDKIQRMKMLLSDAMDLSDESFSSSYSAPLSHTANLTVVDINALLTDIDNQFELVQRMITFLRSEISTMEAIGASNRNPARKAITQHDSIESALDGLSLAEGGSHQSREEAEEDGSVSLVRQSASCESLNLHSPRIVRRTSRRKEPNVWNSLRSAVKQTKRPNYSFEIYEQMMDSRTGETRNAQHSEHPDQLGERAALYRHYSSAYRALQGSHRQLRNQGSADVHHAVEAAVSNYQRAEVDLAVSAVPGKSAPSAAAASSSAQTPDTKKHPSTARSPFVTSPTWKLAADSPGDWRHIQVYADRSKSGPSAAKQPDTKASTASGAGDKGYVSPLIGILEHINKYPERLPKAPAVVPRPSAVSVSTAAADANTSETAYAPSLVRRERSNKLVDSPDTTPRARSSSKDVEKALFSPQMGGFAGAALGSTRQAASSGSDAFGSKFGSSLPGSAAGDRPAGMLGLGSDGAKKATKTTIAPTALSPPAAPATSPAATRPSAAAQAAPAIPTTVADIAQRVREIYAAAVPEKLSDVPKLLVKYAGKETELLEKVIKKYGNVPPAQPTNKSPSATPQSPARKSSLSAHEATSAERKGSGSFGGSDTPINIRKGSLGTPSDAGVSAGTGLFGLGSGLGGALGSGAAGGLAGAVTPTSLFSPGKPLGGGVGGATTPTAATATPTLFGGRGTSSLFGKPAGVLATSSTAAAGWGAGGASSLFGNSAAGTASIASATAAPTAGAAAAVQPGSVEDVLRKVQAIYTQHNPSKLSEIPQLMEKYKGKELQLIANLEKKYGPTPAPATAASSTSAPAHPASVFGSAPGAAPSTGFGATGFGAGAGSSGGAGGTSSLFGGKPSTGFGQAAAPTTAPAVSGFASPFAGGGAAKTPSPFGASSAAAGTGVTPSPFGAPSAAVVPSPFGNATGAAASGGIGSLFGGGKASGASPGTGFGQPSPAASATGAAAASGGTGGLFGTSTLNRGSAGVAGNASPFGNTAAPSTGTSGGSLFGGSSATGGAARTSPFSSGYSTPLGKTSGAPTMGAGTGFGQTGGTMLGGTTSPSVFGNRSAAPTSSLFGGGAVAGANSGFGGGAGQSSSLFGTSHAAQPSQGQGQQSHSTALNSVQDVYQRVRAIYSQHNPSKLSEIPQLMEKYKGKELQLIANLEKKYNINSAQMGNTAPSTGFGGGFGGATSGAANSSVFGQGNTAAAPSTGFGANTSTPGGSLFGRPSPSAAANPAGSSLFGNPSSSAAAGGSGGGIGGGGGGLFGGTSGFGGGGMGATAGATPFAGMQNQNQHQQPNPGAGMGQGSVFGSTSRLGGTSTATGFGSTFGSGGGGGGSLFGGGAANANNMWGNR